MNVLLVSPQMDNPNGGIAIWTDAYLSSLKNSSVVCKLVNTAAVGVRAENGNAKRNYFDEFVRTKRILSELKRRLDEQEYDIAHINTSCGTFGVIRDYLTAKRIKNKSSKTKIVVHYHCDIPYQVTNKISKYFLGKLDLVSDLNFVLCENSREYLKNEFKSNSTIIPNFIAKESVITENKVIRENIEKAFFVGRVEIAKGAAEIFELARRFPEITFELAGFVSEEVSGWEVPKNVVLPGLVSHGDVLRKMDDADVFLFPSHSEGFSLALLESMSRGMPVIATDVGANSDMVEKTGGIVVSVGNVDELEKALKTMGKQDVRRSMSEANVNKVQTRYTIDRVISKIQKYYSEVLKESN